ncbi:uncharacterized protein EV420DRAFT_1653018 [Desarmillaria tabescens]|uniref:Uncharacterized protein n=1 Tax=Armillaria tabescens TaxID=1929756 RepID=A0AA39J5I8_ARMTA|nr:uncharacterized protein EV420DRAFT_1653018 [Desarmillaria tabescens]KAK0435702.1 hypothetical protein EV420DRAFT_1653018 [Desarmillaria tabescens]
MSKAEKKVEKLETELGRLLESMEHVDFDDGVEVNDMCCLLDDKAHLIGDLYSFVISIKAERSDMLPLRTQLIEHLRSMELQITVIGTQLPTPAGLVMYDAGHIYDDGIDNLNLIAQLMILLGVVCNIVMQISKGGCNFILGVAGLIS